MTQTTLIHTLEGVRRRVRLLGVLYGAGIVIAAAIGLLVATVLLDYLLNLPPIPRIIVSLASLTCIGYLLTHWVVRPALAKLGLSDVAGKLENHFPDFNDRLRSTVDFLTKGTPGSDVMKDRTVAQATEMAGRFNLNSAIESKPVLHSFAIAGAALAITLLIGLMVGSEYLGPAFSRLFTPFSGQPWPKRVEIKMVSDLPQRVPVGRPIDVRMRLIKGDSPSREAIVHYQYGSGRVEKEFMSRGSDGVFSASLDARIDSPAADGNGVMTVWIESGDDATTPKDIAVVQRLAIATAELIVTPPPYVGEPPTTVPLDAAPATVTFGSTLALKVTFNKTLSNRPASLLSGEKAGPLPTVVWDAPTGSTVVGHWAARESATFQIQAFDVDNFANADLTDYQVIVRPDQPPTVQITRPAHNEECTPQAVIPLRAIAEDDYGIKSLKLVAVRLGDKPMNFPAIDLIRDSKPVDGVTWMALEVTGDKRRLQMDFGWDLSHLDAAPLSPGQVIEYHLEAQDNFAFEGQYHNPVSSAKFRITILSQDQFTSLMTDLMAQIRQSMVDIRDTQRSLKDETQDLRHQSETRPEFNKGDRQQAQALTARQATAAAQAKQSSTKLDELVARMEENRSTAPDLKDIAASVAGELNQVAENPMKDAANQIDEARNQKANPQASPDKQKEETTARNNVLDTAQDNQQQAADKLDQLITRMGEAGGLAQAIQRLQDILAAQHANDQKSNLIGMQNLGKTPDQMDPKDQKSQQNNADEQAKLGDKTQKEIERLDDQSKKLAKTDPDASAAMKQSAQAGQEQSVVSQMKNSAQAQQQNQQAGAQQAQAQIEIGLQTMLRVLEEAQQHKLEDLAKKLADMQDQVAALIRQQASLNYENLSLQGGEVLSKTDAKLLDSLITLAEWTKGQLPPTPDMGTQVRLQEQTERNTRAVSKTAQTLPEGAAITSPLNRAADRMSRAIVYLRDEDGADPQRLAAAYEPPQVEALAALQDAKQRVDEQLAKVNDQLNQKRREAIRAAFQKILDGQKKLDADTLVIDKSAHTGDGKLGHLDATRLAQLPGEQGGLADHAQSLNEDLSALGSIVYVWANKDIVDTMQGVQGSLAKPDTGVPTQAEQARIEDQLQAMIDSLMVKPKQVPFTQRAGGGGQCTPHMPPEAELRLIKRLQEAVNKSTQTISAQPATGQSSALAGLGGRQGQLRTLLDQLLVKFSGGQFKLGPEPDPKDKLPEEAGADAIDNNELMNSLLTGAAKPDTDNETKAVDQVGQRMGRSHQRLETDKDPGAITQVIQKRILENMDVLIEMARQEQAETHADPSKSKPNPNALPNPVASNAKPGNSTGTPRKMGGHSPAQVSTAGRSVDITGTPTTDIAETLKEWGALSPRQRAAVIEAASEKPVEKFKDFIDAYYQALGSRATDGATDAPAPTPNP